MTLNDRRAQDADGCAGRAQIRVGERIKHLKRPDVGVGELIAIYPDGRCDARFPRSDFSWVPLSDIASVELEERARLQAEMELRQKSGKRAELLSKLREQLRSHFLDAEKYFSDTCAGLITPEDFELEKVAFVKSWTEEHVPPDASGRKRLPDDEQAAAIAAVNGHVQVIARAGSGKTSTLVYRALFLMKHCGIGPSELLLLAFNRKAALEIRRRLLGLLEEGADTAVTAEIARRMRELGRHKQIDKEEIEANAVDAIAAKRNVTLPHVMTFHALAYAIVHPEESLLYDDAEAGSQSLSRAFQQVIDDYLQEPATREQIRELMLAHFREDWDRIVEGCFDKSREELLTFRRSLPRETLRGDYVKSFGEKLIADFLFEHDIAYKYERNHWWSGMNYRPDFTIFKTPKSGVIIEYFGLSGDPDYDEMSEKKRAYWDGKQDWDLIEFSPSDIRANGREGIFALLQSRLEAAGVACKRLSEDEIWRRIRDRAVDRFTTAALAFVGRCRKRSLSAKELRGLIDSHTPLSEVEGRFLELACQLYGSYLDRLVATGEDDFDGLMQRAADKVTTGQTLFDRKAGGGDLASLRYVCIDEYQDFSDLFYRLIRAIREQNRRIELFCVGDDWQAINGFAGSDLRFFENFKEYVGESRQLHLSTNYRSAKAIVEIGNALMHGIGTPAVAHKTASGRVFVSDLKEFEPSVVEKERHSGDVITPAVLRLANKAFAEGLDVVMLSRRNSIPWFVSYPENGGGDGRGLARYLELVRSYFPKGLKERISISTTHKYKGLEKPMVIVLDAIARSYPLIHPDWAFSRVLGDTPEKLTKEERRLLYVALTRAIEILVILTDGRSKSPLLEEIEDRLPLTPINWADYSPVRGARNRLVVRVGNQDHRGGGGTFVIKDLLKATGYQWQSTGWPAWAKSFPAEGFDVETLKAEVWAEQADGIEVRIHDDEEKLAAKFKIDAGDWHCLVDQMEYLCATEEEENEADEVSAESANIAP